MKQINFKLLLVLIIGSLIVNSCKESDEVNITEVISDEETITLVEIDDISDEVNNLIDDYFAFDVDLSSKLSDSEKNRGDRPDCVTKTIVLSGNTKTVTLDFGDGCEMPNGNILSGKIVMSFNHDSDLHSLSITYYYDNFYFNELSIEGENTLVRVRENDRGNRQSTLNFNVTVTWPDGEFATRNGTKVREWVEGRETRTWGDNVYLITGNWTAKFRNGNEMSATVTEPLRREMACRFIVSGIVELQKNDRTGTLNFGDGSCDNKALYTNDSGEEREITLRKRRF